MVLIDSYEMGPITMWVIGQLLATGEGLCLCIRKFCVKKCGYELIAYIKDFLMTGTIVILVYVDINFLYLSYHSYVHCLPDVNINLVFIY